MDKTHTKNKTWKEFFDYWDKEADEIRKQILSPEDCGLIKRSFELNDMWLLTFNRPEDSGETLFKKNLVESKLITSLSIARSKYVDKHPPLSEKFIDSIGKGLSKMVSNKK